MEVLRVLSRTVLLTAVLAGSAVCEALLTQMEAELPPGITRERSRGLVRLLDGTRWLDRPAAKETDGSVLMHVPDSGSALFWSADDDPSGRSNGGPQSGASLAQPASLDPVRAWVVQVAPDAIQFWMQLSGPLSMVQEPSQWDTYEWFIDTDCSSTTGERHRFVGSEHNLRACVRNHPDGGGYLDDVFRGLCVGPLPMLVAGDCVVVRVPLSSLGGPAEFRWSYMTAGASTSHDEVDGGEPFRCQVQQPKENRPTRVVIEPMLMRPRDGVYGLPRLRAYDQRHVALDPAGRDLRYWCYPEILSVSQQGLRATPGKVGWARVTGMVDGVLASNIARVMVGTAEVRPTVINTVPFMPAVIGRATPLFLDAMDRPVDPTGHLLQVVNDNDSVAAVSPDGAIGPVFAGGPDSHTVVRYRLDELETTNGCLVSVTEHARGALPAEHDDGEYVSFWYTPVDNLVRNVLDFAPMVKNYDLTRTLDAGYLLLHDLTGTLPAHGGRQHIATRCTDMSGGGGGCSGNPITLTIDPLLGVGVPRLPEGPPQTALYFHEMAHEFQYGFASARRILWDNTAFTRAAHGEGVANLCSFYVLAQMAADPERYGLRPQAVAYLRDPATHRSVPSLRSLYVEGHLVPYLRAGARFPDAFSGDVATGMYIELADRYGLGMYHRFFSIFWPPDEDLGVAPRDITEEATFLVAAMSAAAQTDLRELFRSWGLPCTDELFEGWLPELTWRAAQRD